MTNKTERARAILREILQDSERFLRRQAPIMPGEQSRVELHLRHGGRVKLEYSRLESVLAPLNPHDLMTEDTAVEWTQLEVRIDSALKLKLSYCAGDLRLLSYVPGQWERRFGVNPAGDGLILLPASLQNHGALPAGYAQGEA